MSSNFPGYGNSTTQQCQRCGTPLSPDAQGYCGNCGMQNASAPSSSPAPSNTSSGQLPFSSNTAWGGDQAQSAQGSGQLGQPGPSRQFGRLGQFGGLQRGITPPSGSLSSAAIPQLPFGNQQAFNTPSAPLQPFGNQQPFGGSSPSQSLSNTQQPFAGPSVPQQTFKTQQAFGSPSSPLQPLGSQQAFGTQGQFAAPNNFAGAGGSPSSPNAPFAPQPQQPFNQQSMQPVPANNFQQGNMNTYEPDSYEDPDFSDDKKKPRSGLIIGSIVLLIILIGGGIGGYLFIKSHKPTTATTQSVTPTPTPKGPLLFHDTFQNNNEGWNLAGQAGEYSLHIGSGFLTLEDDNNRLLWELLPGSKTFNNFLLNVDAVLSKGTQDNGYGVYIRGASNQTVDIATYYRFELYGDGTFAVFKGTLDASGTSQSTTLVTYTISSAIQKQGHVNHISILANGSTFSFIVNGQLLKSFTDNSYTSGSIALFVSNLANTTAGAQAEFSNLAIYPPQ